jgi:hypothetical protein
MASFLIRFLTAFLFTSTSWPFPGTGRRVGVVMPPVFVQEAETAAWNSSPATKSTSSFSVKAGDVLVAYAGQENGAGSMTISGGSLTWTKNQEFNGDGGNCSATIWTAVVDTDKTMSVTFGSSTSVHYGGNVLTFRRSEGLGSSNKAQDDDVLPSVNITTTKANSAIAVFSCDWNATDGASRAWKNNAGAFTELSYNFEANIYTIYGGYHANAGAAGTYAVGLNAPNSQKFSIVAMEIKGL